VSPVAKDPENDKIFMEFSLAPSFMQVTQNENSSFTVQVYPNLVQSNTTVNLDITLSDPVSKLQNEYSLEFVINKELPPPSPVNSSEEMTDE